MESLRRGKATADFVGVGLPGASMAATPALRRQAGAATERFVEEWRIATGGCAACEDDGELEPS